MWESPAWIGTLISGKINANIAEANREANIAIADANRAANIAIADANRANEYTIAMAGQANQAAIAEANRTNDYLISSERNAANIKVAEIQADTARLNRESNETIAANDRSSREAIAAAQRENDYNIAQMKSGVEFVNTGVRTVFPLVLPFAFNAMSNVKSNSNNNKNDTNKKGPTINADAGLVSVKEKKAEKAREKAESLFPDLEPTWDTTPRYNLDPLPTISNGNSFGSKLLEAFKNTTAAFGAAVLTGVTLAPFITI